MFWCRSSVSGVQDSRPPAVTLECKRRDSIHGAPMPCRAPSLARTQPCPSHPVPCPEPRPGGKHVQSWGGGLQTTSQPVIRLPPSTEGEGGDPTRYESLLENLDGWCPEMAGECHRRAWGWGRLPAHALKQGILGLTEELRWRSGLPPQGDGRRRRLGTQRGHQEQGPPSRPRRVGSLLSWTQEPGPGAR